MTPTASPSWFVDELAYAGRENLDAGHVSRYDAKEDADALAEVALLRDLGLAGDAVLVDLGAGTGQLTLAAAPHCARVVAVDVSPVMLERLQDKVTASGLTNVELVRAGFLTYDPGTAAPDVVYSRYALHHLPDFWKAMALVRIRRMLAPGGVFRLWDAVYDFAPDEAEQRLEAWCATGGESVDAEWSRAEIEEHIRDEHSTFSWILEPMLERAGFEIVTARRSADHLFSQYVLRAA